MSDTLAGTEAIAMAAVKGLFPAATGELTVEGEPDFDGAREIMYGPEYHAAKARIAALISDVFKLIEARTNEEIAAGRAYGRRLKAASFVFVVLSLVVLGVSAVILRRRVAKPVRTLEEAARSVEAGEFPRLAPGRTSWDFPCAPLAGCPSLSKTTFSVESRASGSSALSKSSSARETGLLRFARAGHPLPVVARRGHAVTVSEDGGLPLGITDDAEFPDVVLQLEPGDRVYLYSDGCAEQLAASGRQQFGDERVGALLAGSEALTGAESIARLVRELALWAGADRFTDDVSLLVLEWGREEKTYGEAE